MPIERTHVDQGNTQDFFISDINNITDNLLGSNRKIKKYDLNNLLYRFQVLGKTRKN